MAEKKGDGENAGFVLEREVLLLKKHVKAKGLEGIQYEHDRQKAATLALARELRGCIAGWQKIQANVDKRVSRRSAKHVALAQLCRRQLAFLDGAVAAAEAGRPEVVITVLRSLYEGWLSMAAICFLPNPANKKGYWGRRYLAFGKFQRWHTNQRIRPALLEVHAPRGASEHDVEKSIRDLERDWMQHTKEFPDMSDPNGSWHNLGGTTGLYSKLWPKGGKAVFPRKRFKGGRAKWEEWFEMGFRFPSQFAHGQPGTVGAYAEITEKGSFLNLDPVFQEGFLRGCQGFAFGSVEMLSDALGINEAVARAL